MFPEYRELMDDLSASDSRFLDLCQKHGALDQRIRNMETHAELGTHEEIETLKKQKLLIKDRIFATLRRASTERVAST